jgi:hypothetical protein
VSFQQPFKGLLQSGLDISLEFGWFSGLGQFYAQFGEIFSLRIRLVSEQGFILQLIEFTIHEEG